MKDVQNIHTEMYKTWLRNLRRPKWMERGSMFLY